MHAWPFATRRSDAAKAAADESRRELDLRVDEEHHAPRPHDHSFGTGATRERNAGTDTQLGRPEARLAAGEAALWVDEKTRARQLDVATAHMFLVLASTFAPIAMKRTNRRRAKHMHCVQFHFSHCSGNSI
jgi:hypothetical protein